MIRHGQAPYLECSSRGDKRFSALYARVRTYGGDTIENIYQGAKVILVDGDLVTGLPFKLAKGRPARNMEEVHALYSDLWFWYIAENPSLLPIIQAASGLSDVFGQPGSCCQATELWRIRSQSMGG